MSKLEIPSNYSLPEDVADGDTFEELTTYRVEGEYLVPTMIAGIEIPSEDEGSDMEENATPEEEAAASEMEKAPMRGMAKRVMGMA